jgi:molybdopterin converting factor small subunit
MPDVYVKLPFGLEDQYGERGVHCDGETVGDVLATVASRFDRLDRLIFRPDGSIRVTIILNGCRIADEEAWGTRLRAGDHVSLLPHVKCYGRG